MRVLLQSMSEENQILPTVFRVFTTPKKKKKGQQAEIHN